MRLRSVAYASATLCKVCFLRVAVIDCCQSLTAESFEVSSAGHYAKPPLGGPEAVLAYLSRYTHRIAISNSRLISADAGTVAFRWKDYRIKRGDRTNVMRLATDEFIRRFLMHVLPDGFHRIRHYGLLAAAQRKANIAKILTLLGAQKATPEDTLSAEIIPLTLREPCPDCGRVMRIIETFKRGKTPKSRAPPRKQAA